MSGSRLDGKRVRRKDCISAPDRVAHPELRHDLLYTDERCPDCGFHLTIDRDARKVTLDPYKMVKVLVAVCAGCEFIREL